MTRPGALEWLRPQQGTAAIARGTLVRDPVTGRVGVLQDVRLYSDPSRPSDAPPKLAAFLRPVGGGREWTTDPERIRPEPTTSAPPTLTEAVAAHSAEGGPYGTGATEYDRFSKTH